MSKIGLAEVFAAGQEVSIGGMVLTVKPLTLGKIGQIDGWVRSVARKRLNEVVEELRLVRDAAPETIDGEIRRAVEDYSAKLRAGEFSVHSEFGREVLASRDGAIHQAWMSISESAIKQGLTEEAFAAMLTGTGAITEVLRVMAEVNGWADAGESVGAKMPPRQTSENCSPDLSDSGSVLTAPQS